MSGLGTPVLVVVFVVAAAATWGAGVYLAKTTHALDHRFGLGEALGGLILLAVTGACRRSRSPPRPPWPATSTLRSET